MTPAFLEEIYRKNVSFAKMILTPSKLEEYREWFIINGIPKEPTPLETAALELLEVR